MFLITVPYKLEISFMSFKATVIETVHFEMTVASFRQKHILILKEKWIILEILQKLKQYLRTKLSVKRY